MTSLATSGQNSQAGLLKLQEPTFKAVALLSTAAEQKQAAVALVKAVTLPVAVAQGQQLAALLADDATVLLAKNQLAEMLNDVFRFFGQQEAEYAPMKAEIGGSIVAQFANLNIEEIALAFQYGKAGRYGDKGKPFGKLNGSHILAWLTMYQESEEKAGFWERNSKELRKPKEPDDILSVLASVGALGTAANGRIQLVSPTQPAQPQAAPGTAAWYRQEADRIEAREKAQAAEFERNKQAGLNRLLADEAAREMRAQVNTDFEAFAQEQFYSLLTAQEKAIITAARARLLTPAELAENARINERWQQVVRAWEQGLEDSIRQAGEQSAK